MLFGGKINSLIYFVPSIFMESLSTSFAAQIGVAPILFITFGQFNPLSPIINALVLWITPAITVISEVVGIISIISFTFLL